MSCPFCGKRYTYTNPIGTVSFNTVSYPSPTTNVNSNKNQNKCDESQKKADAVCAPGPSGDLGRFNAGEALGKGLACFTAQKIADKDCKK